MEENEENNNNESFEETNWSPYNLNIDLNKNISSLFETPTEIQKRVLIYTSAKVDLIVQARTGEGKTLCYLIPILNYIYNFYERNPKMIKKISPVSLIIVPTHELGVQVKNHIENIIKDKKSNKIDYNISIANILGGFAKPKQLKILNKKSPEIIIATPGRLWEIIENEESQLLENIKYLKFLVIDEADRMTQTGHFKELKNIFQHIYNRIEIKGNNDEKKNNVKEKIKNIGGNINKENDIIENEKLAKLLGTNIDNIETIDPMDLVDENANFDFDEIEYENEEEEEEKEEEDNNKSENEGNEKKNKMKKNNKGNLNIKKIHEEKNKENDEKIEFENKVGMRTILCSATIDSINRFEDNKKNNKKNKNKSNLSIEQQQFQNLIKNLKFYNKLIYIKLKSGQNLLETEEEKEKKINKGEPILEENQPSILPSKMKIDCYKCETSIKDYYLYYILKENINSKIIIFTNSISHTKKLHSIFSYFNEFKCSILHSKMQQNIRMKNLDKFTNNKNAILFCTDIGARGLDIPFVDLVIHYHIPLETKIFVHRSGRTARAKNNGRVTSLISEKELGLYKRIMIDLHYKEFSMKTLSLNQIERIKSLFEYAKEIERENFKIKKENKEKQWYDLNAKKLDIIYDDDDRDDEDDVEKKMEKKYLNKKRKLLNKEKFHKKKIYTKLNEYSIKRSSFLTPDQVNKLNNLLKDEQFKNENITKALFDAKNDARVVKKDKPKKRRYMHRRKGK